MISTMTKRLGRFNSVAVRVCVFGTISCLAAMVVVILLQVVARYVFNAPLPWPEEISRILMVWMTFLAAPYAYRNDLFVRLESWITRFPKSAQRVIEIGVHGLLILLFVAFLRESVWMVERGSVIRASSMNLSMGLVFVVMPIAFTLLICVGVERILMALNPETLATPSGDES